MSYIRTEAGYGRVLTLAMEHDFPERMEEWKAHLREGRMTHEMRDVFQAMGYPVPRAKKEKDPPPPPETVEDVVSRESAAVEQAFAQPSSQRNSAEDMQAVADEQDAHVRLAHGDEPLSDYESGLLDEPQRIPPY